MTRQVITPREVHTLIRYDPASGALTWRRRSDAESKGWNKTMPGTDAFHSAAGAARSRAILFGSVVFAPDVAWCHYYGRWPSYQVTQVNGEFGDNRITNLVESDQPFSPPLVRTEMQAIRPQRNPANQTCGAPGCSLPVDGKNFCAEHLERFNRIAARMVK